MVRKILFLVLGFGMVTAGIAGITTSIVDEKHRASLREIERVRDETRTAAADEQLKLIEEQRKIEEERRRIERIAAGVEQGRLRLMEKERRLAEEQRRSRKASDKDQKIAAVGSKSAKHQNNGKGKEEESRKKPTVLSKEDHKAEQKGQSESTVRRSPSTKLSKFDSGNDGARWTIRKAGMEAARLSEPVRYYNRRTGEMTLAEPLDYGPGSVRVRVRVWLNERLVKDTLVSFSHDTLREPGRPQMYGMGYY